MFLIDFKIDTNSFNRDVCLPEREIFEWTGVVFANNPDGVPRFVQGWIKIFVNGHNILQTPAGDVYYDAYGNEKQYPRGWNTYYGEIFPFAYWFITNYQPIMEDCGEKYLDIDFQNVCSYIESDDESSHKIYDWVTSHRLNSFGDFPLVYFVRRNHYIVVSYHTLEANIQEEKIPVAEVEIGVLRFCNDVLDDWFALNPDVAYNKAFQKLYKRFHTLISQYFENLS